MSDGADGVRIGRRRFVAIAGITIASAAIVATVTGAIAGAVQSRLRSRLRHRRRRFADLSKSGLAPGMYVHVHSNQLHYLSQAKRVLLVPRQLQARNLKAVSLDAVSGPAPATTPPVVAAAPSRGSLWPIDCETAALDLWSAAQPEAAVELLFAYACRYLGGPRQMRALLRSLDLAAGVAIRENLPYRLSTMAEWVLAAADSVAREAGLKGPAPAGPAHVATPTPLGLASLGWDAQSMTVLANALTSRAAQWIGDGGAKWRQNRWSAHYPLRWDGRAWRQTLPTAAGKK